MIKNGVSKRFTDHRDYDLLKTFGAVGFDLDTLPADFSVDAGLTMPDQVADGYPYGCTGYAQTDLCTNEDKVVYDAGELYRSTPPYDGQGRDMRASLAILTTRGPKTNTGELGPKRTAFYNIYKQGGFDWFDAIKVGLFTVREELRAGSSGMPWFTVFEDATIDGILPTPTRYVWQDASSHNAVISGWKTINGVHYLCLKSWQGVEYGDRGWVYMSREITNNIFDMYFTEIFTVTKRAEAHQTVAEELSLIELFVSYLPLLLQKLLAAMVVKLGWV